MAEERGEDLSESESSVLNLGGEASILNHNKASIINHTEGTIFNNCELIFLNQDDRENIMVREAENSELLYKTTKSEQETYDLYNDYAFLKGFSIRRNKVRNGVKVSSRQYCCSHEGVKKSKGRCYSKQDFRTDCKAKIIVHIDENGIYTVTRHDMVHNHVLCPEHVRHHLRSHKRTIQQNGEFLMQLIDSGVNPSEALRAVQREKEGSPVLSFTARDGDNDVAREKKRCLEGCDANALIQLFMKRKDEEPDFFFDLRLDEEGNVRDYYYRDGRMKDDYEKFGDIVLHDTTLRTNRYDMICGPLFGMNQHGKVIMFGCGFLLDETSESFCWLFETFLKSMNGKHPSTLMTDQCVAMEAAIRQVFRDSHHMLCVWHLVENSKKHIRHLRTLKGFVQLFDHLLKYVDLEAEFELDWKRLVTEYDCDDNEWLRRLYDCRPKWCPAFFKDHFSGGIMSSQRSESTNKSISARLYATAGLVDLYSCLVDVVNEWRSKENEEDFRCLQGRPQMIINHINMLTHARRVYTIELYFLFEEQFLKSMAFHQHLQEKSSDMFIYHVGKAQKGQATDLIQHVVTFNQTENTIVCTCHMFTQVGLLCGHSLRILNYHCVDDIPEKYILRRWTKEAMRTPSEPLNYLLGNESVSASMWRTQMARKFSELVSASLCNNKAKQYMEEAYQNAKELVDAEIKSSSAAVEQPEDIQSQPTAHSIIHNPAKRHKAETNYCEDEHN